MDVVDPVENQNPVSKKIHDVDRNRLNNSVTNRNNYYYNNNIEHNNENIKRKKKEGEQIKRDKCKTLMHGIIVLNIAYLLRV